MTRLLTIDTSGLAAQVALALDGILLAQEKVQSKQASQSLLRLVGDVLRESNVSLRQVDAICVVTGPGSFTGLRVGVGVAQGLSAARGIPLLGVSTLALHAKAAFRHTNQYNHCVVCLNARETEFYVGFYEIVSGQLKLQGEEFVLNLNNNPESNLRSEEDDLIGAGDGWQRRKEITNALKLTLKGEIINNDYTAADIIDLAQEQFEESKYSLDEVLLPNYVKNQLDYS
ncbi:MAG: tRNA (adenosine(37)-N6)-threonylcarbamoyltransferase complex dimerization subunit type 1 TsaB [Gammaproteobacteria bacterium]|nr:tRNA (adenosine(37)-N6)-threonylcarbamoyltransferase complex dimerization subunit type 1 TsaB [Gammaproteobacteria bacterium]